MKSTPLPRVTLDVVEWTRAAPPGSAGRNISTAVLARGGTNRQEAEPAAGFPRPGTRGAKFMGEHLGCGLSRSLTDSESVQ